MTTLVKEVEGAKGGGPVPHFYVLINNVAKKTNVGNMLRSACAFNAKGMLVVGRKKEVSFFGAKGTTHHVPLHFFDSLESACDFARRDLCDICGVEIMEEAKPVIAHPFRGPTCFILGNEGIGLLEKEKNECDYFTYIPHFGNGTASLNVNVAASIVFHHFATFAGYKERERSGEKFVVVRQPVVRDTSDQALQLKAARDAKRKEADIDLSEGTSLFE